MKIQLMSDLHLEMEREGAPVSSYNLPQTDADVLVLAGDIDTGARGLRWAKLQADRLEIPVIYVAGNHEAYGFALPKLTTKLRRAAKETAIHFLHKNSVVIQGARFLGTTLWTDFNANGYRERDMLHAQNGMNDYRCIRYTPGYKKLFPEDLADWHLSEKSWLERELAQPWQGPTVVVTHHAPSPKCVRRLDDPLAPAYFTDLESMMGPRIPLWIHGHTHRQVDVTIRGTRVVSNQGGYPGYRPVRGFDPGFTVEI